METSGTNPANQTSTQITKEDAQTYHDNYMDDCVNNKGETEANVLRAVRIDKSAIDAIFGNDAVVYLRVYIGQKTVGGDPTAMFVGVDRYNENLTEIVYNNSVMCPDMCPVKHFDD